jgi:hypothetical protein
MIGAPAEDPRKAALRLKKSAMLRKLEKIITARGYGMEHAKSASSSARKNSMTAANALIAKRKINDVNRQHQIHLTALQLECQDELRKFPSKKSSEMGYEYDEGLGKFSLKKAVKSVAKQTSAPVKGMAKAAKSGNVGRAALAVGTGGMSETKLGKKVGKQTAAPVKGMAKAAKSGNVGRAALAVGTGGMSETKFGKKVGKKAAAPVVGMKTAFKSGGVGRITRAVVSGGLSETKSGKKVVGSGTKVAKKIGLDKLEMMIQRAFKWFGNKIIDISKTIHKQTIGVIVKGVRKNLHLGEYDDGFGEFSGELDNALVDAAIEKAVTAYMASSAPAVASANTTATVAPQAAIVTAAGTTGGAGAAPTAAAAVPAATAGLSAFYAGLATTGVSVVSKQIADDIKKGKFDKKEKPKETVVQTAERSVVVQPAPEPEVVAPSGTGVTVADVTPPTDENDPFAGYDGETSPAPVNTDFSMKKSLPLLVGAVILWLLLHDSGKKTVSRSEIKTIDRNSIKSFSKALDQAREAQKRKNER